VADLGWVAVSPYAALLVRDNFVFYEPHWDAMMPYWGFTIAAGGLVFAALRPHKTLYQYTSLSDLLRIAAAVTLTIFLALSLSFVSSRLEGVARSIPVIQWLILIGGLVWIRVFARMWCNFRRRADASRTDPATEHVLIIGVSYLTELYLESLVEYAAKRFEVVGILSPQQRLRGRLLRDQMVLGAPEKLPQVLAQLELQGVEVSRIAVTEPIEKLSRSARNAILAVERNSDIKVDWLPERLGLTDERAKDETSELSEFELETLAGIKSRKQSQPVKIESRMLGGYGYVKRGADITLAMVSAITFVPVIGLVALLVLFDVGFPVVFWQKRPGRSGRPFKLYKFRTMRAPHDREGKRIPDEYRSSAIGVLLRRTRLDELPQLYNILVGEMSFIGPRPLLPWDQPDDIFSRLSVRPGLTGLAQVHGDRDMCPNDKNALDIWYIEHASAWLDIKIIVRTALVFARGERIDIEMLRKARKAIEQLKRPCAAQTLIASEAEIAQVEAVHSAA
jgi:lipopolysaccharide/colanic/teichoic acid biosynthesis glycosyltransferase